MSLVCMNYHCWVNREGRAGLCEVAWFWARQKCQYGISWINSVEYKEKNDFSASFGSVWRCIEMAVGGERLYNSLFGVLFNEIQRIRLDVICITSSAYSVSRLVFRLDFIMGFDGIVQTMLYFLHSKPDGWLLNCSLRCNRIAYWDDETSGVLQQKFISGRIPHTSNCILAPCSVVPQQI